MIRFLKITFITAIAFFVLACSAKKEQQKAVAQADSIAKADSVARALEAAAIADSACKSDILCDILNEDAISVKRLDSVLATKVNVDCYCTLSGSRKKIGARIPIVKEFIKEKRRSYTYELTPLQMACYHADLKVVEKILKTGVDPNRCKNVFAKPMNIAATKDNNELLALLAKYKGTLAGCYVKVNFKSVKDLKRLASYGADFNIADDFFQTPPVQEASDYATLKYLLEWGADPNAKSKYGDNLLHGLAFTGEPAEVDLALKYKADLYAKNDKGETPLHRAAKAFDVAVLKKLYPLYDLQKAGVTVDQLIAIAEESRSEANVAYLRRQK